MSFIYWYWYPATADVTGLSSSYSVSGIGCLFSFIVSSVGSIGVEGRMSSVGCVRKSCMSFWLFAAITLIWSIRKFVLFIAVPILEFIVSFWSSIFVVNVWL